MNLKIINMNIIKQWYVVMNQSEVERFKHGKSAERLIYEAIKSYSANGKIDVSLSNREIASRASIAYSTVNRHLPKLIEMGCVKAVGVSGHIGGVINTYRVLLPETLVVNKVFQPTTVSVATGTKSVAGVGVNSTKVKGNKPINNFSSSFESKQPIDGISLLLKNGK